MSLKVASDSMRPLIATGDHILVEPFPEERNPRIGEIVLLRTHDGWLVHRIVGRTAAGEIDFYLQKGDAGHHAHPVAKEAIVGRVVSIEKDGSSIDLTTRSRQVASIAVGRTYQLVDWLLSRGSDLGRNPEDGNASALRVRVSGATRRFERWVALLGNMLVRGRRR
jgi:signal peptidase I